MGALNGREHDRASGYARRSRHGYGEYHDRGWWS